MACNACTHENRPGSFFCSQCGTKLHIESELLGELVRMNGPQQEARLEIPGPVCVIGRASTANIVLEEESVSKQHARLTYGDGAFHIEDLGSSNGTFVNGKRVHEAQEIHPGDLLRLGAVILKLET
jgi:pSer/pThr/pTyr-binding forkhead associated (FHA) protein